MTRQVCITHLFFVDDILTFCIISRSQWCSLHQILGRFDNASKLFTNGSKSTLYYSQGNMQDIEHIVALFDVQMAPIGVGFTYLRFCLQPNGYGLEDWMCVVDKFKKKLCS